MNLDIILTIACSYWYFSMLFIVVMNTTVFVCFFKAIEVFFGDSVSKEIFAFTEWTFKERTQIRTLTSAEHPKWLKLDFDGDSAYYGY